jgi:G3E family GTPase
MNNWRDLARQKVIEGKNVRIAELGGGCVCCSLLGEFEAAIGEIIEKVAPDKIVVETTGLAEPEALVFNIQEALPQCRLDGVISVIDADMLVRFPELGHTTRLQIEADILL